MVKIDLKITLKQLGVLTHHFGVLDTHPINTREIKVARSVLNKVAVKFKKKQIDETASQNLFTKKGKQIKFSLEYHEAHFLEMFIGICQNFAMSEYDRNVLQFVHRILNQKLA